jgi:glycosyltransferase involved in cell wall biosynthesis
VSGKIVVASRTEVNAQRLEQGRTGLLVPPNDPNELTHAILAALFKPEVARSKIEAARQTAGKFRPRQRVRVLERIYESLIQ